LDQYERFLDRSPDRFEHFSRIMGREDIDFLESLPEGRPLVSRLRRDRRRVLRYTLEDLQEEFRALVAVGLMLASSSTARQDSFGMRLIWHSITFHSLCKAMWFSTFFPLEWLGLSPVGLMHRVQDLRESTRVLLAMLTPTDMDHLRNQILDE